MTDVNFRHSSQYCKVSKKLCTKNDERNRGKWQLGIVTQLLTGKDGIVRGAKVRVGKGTLERAVQQLYPLELSCDRTGEQRPNLRPEAPEFRPKRNVAAIARLKKIVVVRFNIYLNLELYGGSVLEKLLVFKPYGGWGCFVEI